VLRPGKKRYSKEKGDPILPTPSETERFFSHEKLKEEGTAKQTLTKRERTVLGKEDPQPS